MLRIYDVSLEVIRVAKPYVLQIERYDRDLGRQLRRALSSVALNLAEGAHSRGGNRRLRYHTAMGSARETIACFHVADAWGYIDGIDEAVIEPLFRIIYTLWKIVR